MEIELTRDDILPFILAGMTYREVARMYGTHPGTIHRILKKSAEDPSYSEKVGSKKRIEDREFVPLWEIHPDFPKFLYEVLPKIIARYFKPGTLVYEEVYDRLLWFAYTNHKLGEVAEPINYFYAACRNMLSGFRKGLWRKRAETLTPTAQV